MPKAYRLGIVIVFIISVVSQIDAEAINLRDKSKEFPSILIENVIRNKRENFDHYTVGTSESENHTVVINQPSDECKTVTTVRKVREKRELFFGLLLPSNMPDRGGSPAVLPAMELAVKKVRAPGGILEGWDITMEYRDTQCSSVYGPLAAFELYTKQKPDAFFGPTCDYVLAPVSRYCGVWEIPVITAGGFAEAFNFKSTHYPTLTRMLGSYKHVGIAAHGILKEFNWNTVMLLYHNHDEASGKGNSDCYFTLGGIYRFLNQSSQAQFDEEKTTRLDFLKLLDKVKKKARIVIMCANPNTIREIMLAAEELNMVDSGEYVFFNIELFTSMTATSVKPWYNPNDNQTVNDRAKSAYTALLTVIAKQPEDDEYLEFSQRVKELAEQKYNYTFTEPVSTFVTAFYDAVLLYAYALNQSIKEDPQTLYRPMNGTKITHLMWNRNFKGITGNVTIDSNGDRISDYSLLDMNPETGYFEIVANYFNKTGLQYVEGKSIHWAGGRTEPPPDRPTCGFDNSLCPDNSLPGYAILSLVLGFAIILMAIASLLGYRHYRLEAEINSMTWKINWNDILPCNPASKHRGSLHSLAKRGSQLTVGSEDLGSIPGDKQLFIPIGFYKGCKVAIKRIHESNITLNREQMLELKRMKDIQHEHLVRFYGACVDPPNCSILTEYCPKGSLQDILENDQIKLDWMFKLSLMHDITRGMHFLHTTDIKSHGNLKSSNCVVDSRFVLKITDFGLHKMRSASADDESEKSDSFAYWRKMLWTAPELLRLDKRAHEGTPKGDVYSFGIIVHEITTRQGPFYLGTDDKSPKEIIQLVMDGAKHNGHLFRPKIDETAFDDVNSIMVKCWNEDPCDRPDFTILKSTIRKINKENETGNIVDNLLQRMEQYANNLEGLVEERTQDYLEEKKKCEELLYQLLPKSVAAQLIFGKPVIAEVFEQVTIYFSDIVGFTSISAASTPMQVVDLLNDLYTCFDSIVENFDVYKVETIGDAYMVVSGLPVRNGTLHAREIARTALALLKNVHKFKIRHRPDEQLRLRIGLHSGSCVAGVVGLKMPRYCLFGDTVNTASRMESNGEALKIHISHSTKTILDSFGTFDTTERGLVDMKGKGKMLTYWLNGEHTNDDIMNHNEQQSTISEASTVAAMAVQSMQKNGSIHNNHKMPNNDKNPTLIHFNNLVKSNNLKNTQYKKMCNLDEDSLRNNVNQPLLTKIS
ncbi:atrial natriuretic peptide receptor 1-like isoform X1 [Bradysia coprophila]|uniref:atrial natriuretic peptide receptor 1-like isoform X1 n=1 Tax=Bradysia coprophila TaxID=38358 RepID=UPI00187D7E43|nr:atrial natriuretic peptide receptor 1-like isoform X1 [Bradysia coprophila]XP_037036995.1 atrial natriuretic peptide receptor 1-like isoform X1 [Bradysia coprophila]XP_037036996.1 atrial natriuretic peptide receptor 1-like isoform X1 [Bradysia coprophila]